MKMIMMSWLATSCKQPFLLATLAAWLLAFFSWPVSATESCAAGYPSTCWLDGDCITSCSSGLQKERDDEFCIPLSDPESKICNNAAYKCCKTKIGAILGICIAGGAVLLGLAAVCVYLTQKSKNKDKEADMESNQHEGDDEKEPSL